MACADTSDVLTNIDMSRESRNNSECGEVRAKNKPSKLNLLPKGSRPVDGPSLVIGRMRHALDVCDTSAHRVRIARMRIFAGGAMHSLAIRGDGTVATWGLNSSGQAPDTSASLLGTIVAVRGGSEHSLFYSCIEGWSLACPARSLFSTADSCL